MRIELVTSAQVSPASSGPGRIESLVPLSSVESAGNKAGNKPVTTTPTADAIPRKSNEEIEAAVRAIDEAVKASNISLKFSRDDESGSIVVELIDQNTGEPVRQIPSEASLRLAAALGKLQGNLINRQA